MSTPRSRRASRADVEALSAAIYRDGIVTLPPFSPDWAERLCQDFDRLFAEARALEGGTVSRGPNRYYFAVHPERLRGFVDLVTDPVITALSEYLLGPDYAFVEIAFDVPLPGAQNQPWHRDFAMSEATRAEGRINALAFNISAVDVTPDMGPFQIAPGTQWEDGDSFRHGMFPDREAWPRYETLCQSRRAPAGGLSARTPLTIHRGTRNVSHLARPVAVLGAVSPEVDTSDAHTITVIDGYYARLPEQTRRRLRCTRVARLEPIVQRHSIEGLVMGVPA